MALPATKNECWTALKSIIDAAAPGVVADPNPPRNLWQATHKKLFDVALAVTWALSDQIVLPMSEADSKRLLTDVFVGILTPESLEVQFQDSEWSAPISEKEAWMLLLAALKHPGLFT